MGVQLGITLPRRPMHNVAIANPDVRTWRRTLAVCWRVTAARSSSTSSAAVTASTWAIDTALEISAVANAHSSDTDLGGDNVTSIAITVRSRRWGGNSSVPEVGSRASINARNHSASTTPSAPSSRAKPPNHTPGASPTPR